MRDVQQSVFDTPAYSAPQAAHYVGVRYETLRLWMGEGSLIVTPIPDVLSFYNLAEAHILRAMRKDHHLSLQSIRKALAELSKLRKTLHPLLDESFETNGVDLCIREEDEVINLSKGRQQEIREFVSLISGVFSVIRVGRPLTCIHSWFMTPSMSRDTSRSVRRFRLGSRC